jgi:hypothetical protein
MFIDLDTNGDSLYGDFIFMKKYSNIQCLNRVSIEELQKHSELDIDRENEFTIEEVRVSFVIFFLKYSYLIYLDNPWC